MQQSNRSFLSQYVTFMILFMGIYLMWMNYFGPKPAPKPKGDEVVAEEQADDVAAPQAGVKEPAAQERPALLDNPKKSVTLGSLDPESGFAIQVELTTQGGAVETVKLNDPRYRALENRKEPLRLVGNSQPGDPRTLATYFPEIDKQLAQFDVNRGEVNWSIVAGSQTKQSVTFEFTVPETELRIQKKYSITKLTPDEQKQANIRDLKSELYQVALELSFANQADKEDGKQVDLTYELQGPVGLPLENEANSRKFRDVRWALLGEDREIDIDLLTADDLVEAVDEDKVESWRNPLRFVGADTQYFATLVVPGGDQLKDNYFDYVEPQIIQKNESDPSLSDVSLLMRSQELRLAPGESATHDYTLYAGPKREELLTAVDAQDVIDYGWFSAVSSFMLWLLNSFHSIGLPYGVAIIMLTILVRGCLFPLSKKQAAGAQKMKDLQPEIAKLKQKYENDREGMARAQMELFSKHNYNPVAGCLPVFFQLPIFIGLYRGLSSAVELRMTPFLWIDNLAAPDAIWHHGVDMPFLGQDFNLLPLITIVLFIVQQKLFMPPPTTDEQAMQQKMMNYMMVFMGFLFYHVPAGLCVYFIASSLWGICERKLLDHLKKNAPPPELKNEPEKPRKPGLFSKLSERLSERMAELQDAANEQQQLLREQEAKGGNQNGKPGGQAKKKKKSKKKR